MCILFELVIVMGCDLMAPRFCILGNLKNVLTEMSSSLPKHMAVHRMRTWQCTPCMHDSIHGSAPHSYMAVHHIHAWQCTTCVHGSEQHIYIAVNSMHSAVGVVAVH
eukprot:Lankesteria_metandrocarpae@DN2954_c0_g1_i2.p1